MGWGEIAAIVATSLTAGGGVLAGVCYVVRNITRLNTLTGEVVRRLDKIDARLDRMEADARNLPCADSRERIARLEGRQRQGRK